MNQWPAMQAISTVPPNVEVLLTDGRVCLTGSTDEDREWFHLATPDHPYNATVTRDWKPIGWWPLPEAGAVKPESTQENENGI